MDLVQEMPKVQLHDHLEGSIRPESALQEATRRGLQKPAEDVGQLREQVSMQPEETLTDFLTKFEPVRYMFDDPESLSRIAYEAVEDNAKDGVQYVELRMNCRKDIEKLSIGEVMDAVLDGMERGAEDFGVEARFIANINRKYPVEQAQQVVEAAVARKQRGVVGVDLGGDESKFPAGRFKEVFDFARSNGLKVTLHAGEAAGPESVREAVEVLKADRIGHGTRMIEDPELMALVRDKGVHLEMCPHSNLLLNVVDSHEEFPLREYHDKGISASLSTDDKHVFGVTLTDEYEAMARHHGFTLQEFQQMNLGALAHSFLPVEDKGRLQGQFREEYSLLNQQAEYFLSA